MPRLCHPSPAVRFGIAAALVLSTAFPALAQIAPTAAEQLLQPMFDGDPRDPPYFRKPPNGKAQKGAKSKTAIVPSRFNGQPIFGPAPATGASITGFDSLNRPRGKRQTGAAARRSSANRTANKIGFATSSTAATPAERASKRRTPAQPLNLRNQSAAALPRNAPPAASRNGAYGYALSTSAMKTMATTTTTTTSSTGVIVPPRRRPPAEEDPFAPIGIHTGSFLFKPAVELLGGYDSNPAHSQTRTGSTVYMVAPELLVQSLWSRHELTANIKGSYTGYGQTPTFNRPNVDGKVNARIDVMRFTRVDLEGRGTISTDTPGSPDLPTSVSNLPINFTYGTTAGLTQRFNRFELTAKGAFDRAIYGDSILNNGSITSNRDRNYVQYGGALRGSYELTPGVKPFVEIGTDARVHDLAVDNSGYQRDSTGRYYKLGSTFELTRKLTGEASAGHLTRKYEDPALTDLSGFIADASLMWTASALTTVKFTAKSSASESTLAGVSGVLTRDFGLEVDHAFRRWLIGTVKFGYGVDLYDGSPRQDTRYQATAALTYKITRDLWLKSEFRQDWLSSNEPGNNYMASTILFGLRLQR